MKLVKCTEIAVQQSSNIGQQYVGKNNDRTSLRYDHETCKMSAPPPNLQLTPSLPRQLYLITHAKLDSQPPTICSNIKYLFQNNPQTNLS